MKKLLSSLLALVVVAGASAVDWGINVTETPVYTGGETTLYVESAKVRPWLEMPLFGAGFRLEGDFSLSASTEDISKWTTATLSWDLYEASLRGVSALNGGALEWDAGRRLVSDLTGGWVVSSRWDGLSLSWVTGRSRLNVSSGYSGVLAKKNARVVASAADKEDLTKDEVQFGPQRVYGLLGVSFVEALLRQDLQVEVLGDYDFRSENELHGAYGTLSLTGPLPLGLRQRLYGTGSLSIGPDTKAYGYLAGAEWSATIPFLGSRLAWSGLVSQGFSGTGFQAISGKGLAEIVTLATGNTGAANVDFSLRPASKTTLGAKGNALFRLTKDAVDLPGSKAGANWLGTELSAYASWNPTSDLSLGSTGGIFVPSSGAFESGTKPTVLGVLTMTLKL